MPFVIVALDMPNYTVDGGPDVRGMMLASYDPEAHDGLGTADWTGNPVKAKKFPSKIAAVNEWRRVPRNKPVRIDGRPNRPLTAFTIEIKSIGPG